MQSQIMSRLSAAGIHARTLNSRFNRPGFLVRNRAQGCRPFSDGGKGKEEGSMHVVKAGLPLFLFCGLGVWVVSNGIDGKNKERDAFQGRISKSERQAVMDKEHDEMMGKLNKFMKEDFDNTKRIERPDEVLARRRKEREARNVWYKRLWRNVTGQQ
mmetsp:Transcript_21683/g.53790  ORF Transcript_21683/g.53790 Transcript_21683/m.53790 type:complete len:157 (+) Transcript_21683:145-615(+)